MAILMKYIAVVDCASSGQMYIDDILEMGFHPLAIYTAFDIEHASSWFSNVEHVKKGIGDKADIIQLTRDMSFDDLINKLKAYEIIAVVPGSEPGVQLADKLNKALNLAGNDPDTTHLRNTKVGMFEALGKAGIRRIESCVVTTQDQIIRFWYNNKLSKAVLKFSESAGTVGFKICNSVEDCIVYFEEMQSMYTLTGFVSEIIIQEYIGGTEYVVNSLSIDGKHKITDLWRYDKIIQDDSSVIYDVDVLIKELTPGMQALIEYDYKVLDAVGMKNGACHTEIKIDEKGPVLIETNARIMGGNLTREFFLEVFGYSLSGIVLKSILEPTFFDNFLRSPYSPRKYVMVKDAIVPRELKADLGPFFELARHLDSFREIVYFGPQGICEYPRTVDMETSPFFIYLVNSDYGKLKKDCDLIRLLEERYFKMLYVVNDHVDACTLMTDIDDIIKHLPLSRKFALITGGKVSVIQYGMQTVSDKWEIYDGAIFAICGTTTLTERFRQMMRCLNHIRKGGLVFIIPEAYQNLPYGVVSAEVVLSIMGFNVEIPPSNSNGVLFAIRV